MLIKASSHRRSIDGEDEGDRLSRRARHWIADVSFGSEET
jgi:hypothetical protein